MNWSRETGPVVGQWSAVRGDRPPSLAVSAPAVAWRSAVGALAGATLLCSCSSADKGAVTDPAMAMAATRAVAGDSAAPGQAGGSSRATADEPDPTPGRRPRAGAEPEASPPGEDENPDRLRATYLIECVDQNLTREPASFTLTCAGANEALDALRWQRWGLARAVATGVIVTNSCKPTCATGSVQRFPVSVEASGLVNGGRGRFYTKLSVRYLGKGPAGSQRVKRYGLPS